MVKRVSTKKAVIIQQRIDDLIKVKAFEIYKRDKCDDPLRNWLQAEKELSGK